MNPANGRRRRSTAVALVIALVLLGCGDDDEAGPVGTSQPSEVREVDPWREPQFRRLEGPAVTDFTYAGAGIERWLEEVPGVADVRIPSSIDDYEQPALWLAPEGDEPAPLLVVLHSWSVDYLQHLGIPYALWARDNGWAMIHPDFRGVLETPEATGSDLTVQDVLDAVDFAREHAAIDTGRVYVSGFSGGGMMALIMAGRHPDRFAGVVAWVPIYDLVAWYSYAPGLDYARQIEASCGGNPTTDEVAAAECHHRSPSSYLDAAAEAGVPVYLGHGIEDRIVPPVHAGWAYNQLASPDDRLDEAELAALEQRTLPEHLLGAIEAETYFEDPDPGVLFARHSGNVTLVVFDAGHEGVFNPGLEWMVNRGSEVHAP
jgi:predicted esterase